MGRMLTEENVEAAAKRLDIAITNDTALGISRYGDAGYDEADKAAGRGNVAHSRLD